MVWLSVTLVGATAPGCVKPRKAMLRVSTGSGACNTMLRVPPPGMLKSTIVLNSGVARENWMASRSVQCAASQVPSLVSASEFTTTSTWACALPPASSNTRASGPKFTAPPDHRETVLPAGSARHPNRAPA
jgi:hypothetical protein